MTNWQPIETAKKDYYARQIIVSFSGGVTIAHWDDEDETWRDVANSDGIEGAAISPTHWMPLPEPPED